MTALTTHEQQEIDRANAEEKQPVVFVHGLWLLASSWDSWRGLFEEQGYATLAPGWPDDPESVEEAKQDPEVSPGNARGGRGAPIMEPLRKGFGGDLQRFVGSRAGTSLRLRTGLDDID